MPKRMKEQFPTVEALMAAAVFDVAGVMLELLSAQPQTQYIVSRNAISAWAAEYGQGETKELIRALSEAWAWLESNGFIADELSAGIGIPGKFVTRAARNVRSRADFLAYAPPTVSEAQRSLLPPQPIEVGLENPLQSAGVFAIADKGFHLEAQRPDLAVVMADFGDLRDAVIEQFDGCGIAEIKFAVSHGLMKLSVEVIGTAM